MEPLTVSGNLDSLSTIRRYVLDAAGAANLDQKRAYRLSLAVDELATNIVTHGYEEAGLTGDIEVRAIIDAKTLTIIIEDSAQPFDPTAHETPDDLDTPLENRQIGGLGIFLALNGIDNFTYERADQRNRNTLVMHRSTHMA